MKKRGQIWVETVIYTLIALSMIGAVLAFVIPRVDEIQDKAIIDQSVDIINNINNIILSVVQGGPGNKRLIEIRIRKGTLSIDGNLDEIKFEMDSSYIYSELGEQINIGSIVVETQKTGSANKVILTTSYSYNLKYNNGDGSKTINQAAQPYTISIENKGKDDSGKTIININVN